MFKQLVVGLLVAGISTVACKKDEASKQASGAQVVGQGAAPLQVKRGVLVARGLGGMGALRNTNSLEALKCNHDRGFRWFEVDLAITADAEIVCFHKGDEKLAELPDRTSKLPISEIEGKKYAGRFGIVRFATLLAEAERLEDVVLMVDTGGWSERMQAAISGALGGPDKASRHTRIVLQAYDEKELPAVAKLSRQIGAGLILNLDHTSAGDDKVEELAKKTPFLAVVSDSKRFTPWLAQRLHTIDVPILVHTLNEHRDILTFTRAGADGFYTDRYVPYETMAADPATATGCGSTGTERNPWSERDAMQPRQFRLRSCAKRRPGSIHLASCDERPAIYGSYLAVPPGKIVHVEVEAEAGDADAGLWFDLVDKTSSTPVNPREQLQLKAKERRAWKYDVTVPQGSVALEARLGLSSNKDKLKIYRFRVSEVEGAPSPEAPDPAVEQDAGE
ncbi:MAG: glycerophosphodiester phosphodiesterase family protein [Deltaproteobacteria bacterium]